MPDDEQDQGSAGGAGSAGGSGVSFSGGNIVSTGPFSFSLPGSGVAGTPDSTWIPAESLPPEKIRGKWITQETARLLAMTRRRRFGEFSAGGFIAALPGSAQSAIDWFATPHVVPTGGHLVEIGLCIWFFALAVRSVFDFREPTSPELLRESFPNYKPPPGMLKRIVVYFRQTIEELRSP